MGIISKITNPLNHAADLKELAADYEKKRKNFLDLVDSATNDAVMLFNLREESYQVLCKLNTYVETLDNCPASIQNGMDTAMSFMSVIKAAIDKDNSLRKEYDIKTQNGVLLGAATVGGAVAVGGSTAALAVATTFGTASTGTAISALGGAAATNAALAWLGGGTLAAGGTGIAGGTAFLGLLGPIGWSIAGVSAGVFLGISFFKGKKNKKTIIALEAECKKIDKEISRIDEALVRVKQIHKGTSDLLESVKEFLKENATASNRRDFKDPEFQQESLFLVVNEAKTISKLSRESANF